MNSLYHKQREQHAQQIAALYADEVYQQQQQTHALMALRSQLHEEIEQLAARYSRNPEQATIDYSRSSRISDSQIVSELESVRLRLELEADTLIEEAVNGFRAQLRKAAQDEIDYILQHSHFSTLTRDSN
ncbi:hypothetical protein QE384_002241 [Acinetobacter baylyi]|nr:hypothetical protein [Acinetobacter baylyi]